MIPTPHLLRLLKAYRPFLEDSQFFSEFYVPDPEYPNALVGPPGFQVKYTLTKFAGFAVISRLPYTTLVRVAADCVMLHLITSTWVPVNFQLSQIVLAEAIQVIPNYVVDCKTRLDARFSNARTAQGHGVTAIVGDVFWTTFASFPYQKTSVGVDIPLAGSWH